MKGTIIMKKFKCLLILIIAVFLIGCAANSTEIKKPEHLNAGMKEIKKGTSWYQKGCYKRSLEHFLRAHELFSGSDQLSGVALSMNNIGNIYRIMGDLENALLFFDESIDIYNNSKNYEGLVQAMSNRAAVLIEGNRLEDAAKLIEEAEVIAQKHSIPVYNLQNNLGLLYIRQKKYSQAKDVLIEARTNIKPDAFGEFATVNYALGRLMNETGCFERAVYFFETALKADRLSGFHKGIADDLAEIGSVYYSQKKYESAANCFKRSIKIYALIENRDKVSEITNMLVKAAKKANLNISITQHFVKNWLEGKAFENPCK